jgi:hypothetical protein
MVFSTIQSVEKMFFDSKIDDLFDETSISKEVSFLSLREYAYLVFVLTDSHTEGGVCFL